MHDAIFVNVLNARDDLLVVLGCLILFKRLRLSDLFEQLVTAAVFHNQEEILVILNDL